MKCSGVGGAEEIVRVSLLVAALAGCAEAPEAQAPAASDNGEPGLRFVDVAGSAGLGDFRHVNGAYGERLFPETMSGGAAVLDYDGNGWPDLLLVGGGKFRGDSVVRALWLFRNQGDGTFQDVTRQAGLDQLRAYGMGLTAGDYDNDGDEDVYFSTVYRDFLFRNEGGRFVDVGEQAGIERDSVWSSSSTFLDADRDGWLDLFVGGYVEWTPETDIWCMSGSTKSYCTPRVYPGVGPRFYRNRGDGTFENRTAEAGFRPHSGKTLGVVALDVNADGSPDLAVANDTEPDQLYLNRRDGTFRDIGASGGMAYDERGQARAGMGIDAGVVDTTGRQSLFVANFSNEMIGVYRYLGDELFSDRAAVSRIGGASRRSLSFGLFLFDAELDGDLDLFVANGHITPEVDDDDDDVAFRQPPHLFLNDGRGQFRDAAEEIGGVLNEPMLGRAAAYLDFDLDGDLDILVTENDGPARLLRNEVRKDGRGPSYLRLSLEAEPHTGGNLGVGGNASAIGAAVTAYVEGRMLRRYVRAGRSYQSQAEMPLTLGLGGATKVDSLIVHWPDEMVVRFGTIQGNQSVVLIAPDQLISQENKQ